MKVYVTTIKHDYDIDPETVLTKRLFTKKEKEQIIDSIEAFKAKNEDWEGSQSDMMDYAVFTPFKDIIINSENSDEINVIQY